MTSEMLIIAAVRLLGSLPVLRWAFVGGLLALLADLSDLFLMNLIDLGGVRDYQRFDKWLDQVYMLTFLMVAWRWQGAPRTVAIALFAYRMVGFFAFGLMGNRDLLLFFPNLFEFWFLFAAGLNHWKPDFEYSRGRVAMWGAGLLAVKLFQEYALHWGRWLDGFTAVEAVEAIWNWAIAPFR